MMTSLVDTLGKQEEEKEDEGKGNRGGGDDDPLGGRS
jgi:hypothetical protein